jgi:aminopeptidase N
MKIFSIIIALFAATQLLAQDSETHPCAKHKAEAYNTFSKKTRAAVNDIALMNVYDVHNYHLAIAAENNTLDIIGATTIGSKIVGLGLDTFAFELHSAHNIDSVMYNGIVLPSWHVTDMGYAKMPTIIATNTLVNITIYYHGTCTQTGSSAIGYGFNTANSPSWGNSVVWSLSQPYSAYHWFACKQSLQDKADSSSVSITTSNTNKAGSNGVLVSIDSLQNNKVRYNWKSNLPIDYYLISVAIAEYVDYTIYAHPTNLPNDSIPIQNYVYNNPGALPNFKSSIDSVAKMIEYFSEKIYLYPFYKEKYGHCMAPFSGGMEHQTMTTQGFFNLTLNAHELFHQWFGDHVTCKTWSDIFVNEGFASYGEYLILENLKSYASAQSNMSSVHRRVKAQLGGSIYFTDTTNARIFSSRLSYDKGAAVIHTLRYVLGDSVFFKTLNNYQTQYAFSSASIDDFKAVAEATSGKNLSDFFNQWIYGEGYVKFDAEYTSNGNAIIIKVNQSGSVAANNIYKTPLQIKCVSTSGDTTVTVNLTQNTHTFYIPSAKIIANIIIDPNNWILDSVVSIKKNTDLLLNTNNWLLPVVHLYPNPATTLINITADVPITNYTIYNLLGKQVTSGIVPINQQINIEALAANMYFIKLTDFKNQSSMHKFTRQ